MLAIGEGNTALFAEIHSAREKVTPLFCAIISVWLFFIFFFFAPCQNMPSQPAGVPPGEGWGNEPVRAFSKNFVQNLNHVW